VSLPLGTRLSPYVSNVLRRKLRRQIGNKVIELGGNAVLGFSIHFDFAETCIVARGYGTSCTLKPYRQKGSQKDNQSMSSSVTTLPEISPEDVKHDERTPSTEGSEASAKDSEESTPTANPPSPKPKKDFAVLKLHTDIQFLTMHSFPPPVLVRLSGIVTVRSLSRLFQYGSYGSRNLVHILLGPFDQNHSQSSFRGLK
jgi:hypothetical protein